MADAHARDEYLDASTNARHWSTLRMAQLTIFIALSGGLLNLLFGHGGDMHPFAAVALRIAGLAVTALYALLQERTMLYWYAAVTRAEALEPQLGFRQYSGRPPSGAFSSRNAMRAFFLVMALFWVATLVWYR